MGINDYKLFYVKDLLPIIDRIAFDLQKEPNMIICHQGDEQLMLVQNASIATYNQGVMRMRKELVEALTKEADSDE